MIKLSKTQLDNYSNICGLVIGIVTVLGSQGWISQKAALTTSGIAGAIACYLTNKPAMKHPNTEDLEENKKI